MLTALLSCIQYKFSVIGLTETKIVQNKNIVTNTDLVGYKFISQPTLYNAVGVGFYVEDSLKYRIREDFSSTTVDFEGLWIEIDCQSQRIPTYIVVHNNSRIHGPAELSRPHSYC